MKNKKFFTSVFTLGVISLIFASCGGGGDSGTGGGTGGGTGETVNQASADDLVSTTSVAENFYRNVQSSVGNISGTPIFFPSLPSGISPLSISKQQAISYCSGTPSGDLTDVDDDGIPVNGTYDFTCNYPNNITIQGKVSARDDNDNDALSGYDVCTGVLSPNCSRNPITTIGSFGTFKQTADFNLDGNATQGYTFTSFYYKWELTSNSGTITAQIDASNLSYDPDADGNNDPWDKGIWNGTINFSASDGQNSSSGTLSLINLYVGACTDGSATGSITYSGTCPAGSTVSNFTLTIDLTSCGHGTVSGTTCDGQNFGPYNW